MVNVASRVTPDERTRLYVLVPNPLTRTEVLLWLEAERIAPTPMGRALIASLFAGRLDITVVDGELEFTVRGGAS